MTDTTRTVQTDTSHAVAEKGFRGMIESTAGIPWVVDFSSFQFTYVGPQAEKILGYPVEQWFETDFWDKHIHPDDRQAALDFCNAELRKGKDYNFEYRMIHRDGHSVWILDYVNIATENGSPTHLQGFMFDISSSKATERALEEKHSRLTALYRASPDMIFIHSNDGRILEINDNASRRYGYSLETMQRMTVSELSAEEDAENKVVKNSMAAMQGENPEFEWLARDSSGKPFPVEVRLRKLDGSDAPGAPAIIAVVRDITAQKQAEKNLRNIAAGVSAQTGEVFYAQLVKHLTRLFDAEYAFIGLIDKTDPQTINTLAVWANDQPADNFSYALEGTPCIHVIGQRTLSLSTGIQQKFPKSLMLAEMGADSFIGSPLFDSQNNPTGLIVVLGKKPMPEYPQIIDTLEIFAARAGAEIERANAELELEAHREHLEELVEQRTTELTNINQELESFSYSVSHDLRAPLRHIDGFSQILQEDYAGLLDDEGKNQLTRIRASAQHMGELIDNLLKLSCVARGQLKRKPLNLSSMAQDIFNKLQLHDTSRKIHFSIQPGLTTRADHHLVHVLLENLIGNAWKYTAKTSDAHIYFESVNGENGEAIFCLRDNGAGFDIRHADKLFTAFQRLHSDKDFEGSGIGLATVQRIITRHAGRVWAESEKEKGASFYFTLGSQTPR